MFFSLPNLVSTAVTPCTPWLFVAPNLPMEVRGKEGKKLRDKWISNPATKHECYTAFEGINAGLRISKPKNGEEGNPPLKLHALVADFDVAVSEDELATGIARVSLTPNYYERTLSEQVRLIWLFEKPVSFPNYRFAVEFLQLALKKIPFEQIAPSLDKPAWEDPTRIWTNSGDWSQVDVNACLPYSMLQGWVVEVSEKHIWRKDRGAIDIPLPIVWVELQKLFPAASNAWPGDFVEGAQGPTFWMAESSSPKSAIVKPTGMFTFSAHATKPFYSWTDLLGKAFVDKYAAEAMGKAVEDIYHDGKTYFRKDGYSDWKAFAKEDVVLHLSNDRGLSNIKSGNENSEVSRAVSFIQNWQGVTGAAPFVFQPTGVLTRNGTKFLNTHTRRVLAPAGGIVVWGPGGPMPILSKFFDGFFYVDSKPANPLRYFLAWWSRFYKGAHDFNLQSGQNVIFLGPPNVGKTFLNQGLLPYLMGGAAEAESYLLGTSDFNSQLFEVGYWTVDDNSVNVDVATHKKFSVMMKKMAANTTFQYHAKFRVPCQIDWRGRVGVTANDDEESARIVPDLSISILDKLSVWRTAQAAPIVFPDRRGCEKIIKDEAPFLARYLLDYVTPPECVGDARFGVKAYHEVSLLKTAEQSSRTATFIEMMEDWRASYFSDHAAARNWEGTAFQLLKELHRDELMREAGLRQFSPQQLATQLSVVKGKGLEWLDARSGPLGRVWTIARPASVPGVPLPTGTKFAKEPQA